MLAIDSDTLVAYASATNKSPISKITRKWRDRLVVPVQFLKDGIPYQLSDSATGLLGLKKKDDPNAVSYMASSLSWTREGTGEGATYYFLLNLNTEQLEEAFEDSAVKEVALVMELSWVNGDEQASTPGDIDFIVRRDYNQGGEGQADDADPPWGLPVDYLTKAGNLSGIASPALARQNIGAASQVDMNEVEAAVVAAATTANAAIPASEKGADNGVPTLGGTGKVPTSQLPTASEAGAGISERANQAEAEAGSDDSRHMTSLKTAQAIAAQRGAANGLAPLGADSKISTSYLPAAVLGAAQYQGSWNASTNSPAIPAAASGNKGYYYVVSVAGSTAVDGESDWKVKDWIISNGLTWQKVDNTDQVTSVAGRNGVVTLDSDDVGLGEVDNTSDVDKPVSDAQQAALDLKAALPILVFDGDSITSDAGLEGPNNTWPKQMLVANPIWRIADYHNVAVSGKSARQLVSDYAGKVTPLKPVGTQFGFYFILAGTNDWARTASEIYDDLKLLWAAARADGFKVFAFTIQPSYAFPGQGVETKRLAVNTYIRSDATLYDYLIDLDTVLGSSSAEYSDGVHPTAASYVRIARSVVEKITAFQHFQVGSGSPEGVVYGNVGNVFLRADGDANTALYVKTTNGVNTGWKAVGTGSMAAQDANSVNITNGTITATIVSSIFSGTVTITGGTITGITSFRVDPSSGSTTLGRFVGTNTSNDYLEIYGGAAANTGIFIRRGTVGGGGPDWYLYADGSTGNLKIVAGGAPNQALIDAMQNGDATFLSLGGAALFGGDIVAKTAGKGIKIKEGTNARMGADTLVAGTKTISTTEALTGCRIFVSRAAKNSSTALGLLEAGTITNATSFVVNAYKPGDATLETGDASSFTWLIIPPAS